LTGRKEKTRITLSCQLDLPKFFKQLTFKINCAAGSILEQACSSFFSGAVQTNNEFILFILVKICAA
jgi:hypothetical protein